MNETYISDQHFEKLDFTIHPIQKANYEDCSFNDCNFSAIDLSELRFSDCVFNRCNMSMVRLNKTAFNTVNFHACKMLGLQFNELSTFGLSFSFEQCQLDHAVFYKLNLKGIRFDDCRLLEADFGECNLTKAVFDHCDLSGALFDQSILEQADFRTAHNFTIDPENNRMKKARFSEAGLAGLLQKYNILIEQ